MVGHKLGEFSATRSFKSPDTAEIIKMLKLIQNMREFRQRGKFLGYCPVNGKTASLGTFRERRRLLGKTLQSAMANAENNNNLNADDLYISEAIVKGPCSQAFSPRTCSSLTFKKHMSHLRITLSDEV